MGKNVVVFVPVAPLSRVEGSPEGSFIFMRDFVEEEVNLYAGSSQI